MTRDGKEQGSGQYGLWMIIAILLAGWTLFCYGCLWQYVILIGEKDPYIRHSNAALLVALSPIALVILAGVFWLKHDSWRSLVSKQLENSTDAIDAIPDSHIGLWIALAAGLSLYTELMIVRLHASFFQLFAYLKNVSLLSCFLGLGIGYAKGPKRPLTIPVVLPVLTLQIALMHFLRQFFPQVEYFPLQNPVSEQLAFGIRQADRISHIMTVYGFLSLIFAFNALCFIPLGHLASRLMMRCQRLISYSWNLVGSLLGVFLFYFLSFVWAPPSIWILFATLMLMAFLRKHINSLFPSALAAIILLTFLGVSFHSNQLDVYSPYQILTLSVHRDSPPELRVNNVYYQRILDLSRENLQRNEHLREWDDHYALPYYLKPEPGHVLIVGSGTGNDVAAAIRHGAGEIDAVEIDPAVLQFGKSLHPESPYQASNVNAIVSDARAFIRHTDKQYDLIVYGFLDSHTLLSGMSGVRLDSYVYTVEAFREARAKLRKGGIISMAFSLLRPELGRKLFLMLREAFDGQSPVVYQTGYDEGYTFLIGDELARCPLYQSSELREVTSMFADTEIRVDKSTDDWPFFYMPVRKYPISYVTMILVLMAISLVFIHQLAPGSGNGFSVPSFFLGAGFMLVEIKGITELALVYGSTWIVVGAVIAAILIMAFLANLLVIRIGSPRPLITYGLLFASLIIGLYLSSANLSTFPPWLSRAIMTILLTLPLFFSAVAFSAELKKSASVAVALSSNLLGAMLGGFLEYNAMYFGFRSLYFLALAIYGFAFWGTIQAKGRSSADLRDSSAFRA